MALVVYWYDFLCLGIVGGALLGSLWVLWGEEGNGGGCSGQNDESTVYESLFVDRMASGLVNDGALIRTGHVSSIQLWSSCWRGVHPIWLLVLRFASFMVMAGLLTWDIVTDDTGFYMYYTEWTFSLVIVYFALGTIISAQGCLEYSKRPAKNSQTGELLTTDLEEIRSTYRVVNVKAPMRLRSRNDPDMQQTAGIIGYLVQIIYQTCGGAVILTDTVFWCLIYPFESLEHLSLTPLNGCMHTLNAFFLLLDASVNDLPFPLFRIAYFVLWSCIYVVFQWVIHACGFPWWPYPFLELSTPWSPLWYFCLALIHIPCYGIFALLIKAKMSILPKYFPQAFLKPY